MQKLKEPVTLSVDNRGWITCPYCRKNRRLMRVLPETTALNLEVYCRSCRQRLVLNIDEGARVKLQSQ